MTKKKKSAKIWAPHPSGPITSGLHFFSGFGPTLWGPTMTHTRSKNGLAKIGFGPNWPHQDGQNGIGQSRPLPSDTAVIGPRTGSPSTDRKSEHEMRSNAPMPSIDRTVARSSKSVKVWSACAMHSSQTSW